jgi:hypothetical protein
MFAKPKVKVRLKRRYSRMQKRKDAHNRMVEYMELKRK